MGFVEEPASFPHDVVVNEEEPPIPRRRKENRETAKDLTGSTYTLPHLQRRDWLKCVGETLQMWRTDLLIARQTLAAEVEPVSCRSGEDNSGATSDTVAFAEPSQQVVNIEDVVEEFLTIGGGSWTGAIHDTSSVPVQAWACVHSVDAGGTASSGQLIEGIPTADMSPDDDPWEAGQQRHIMAGLHTFDNRLRVNIGIVNPTATNAGCWIRAWDPDGNCGQSGCTTFRVNVPPFSMGQAPEPFAGRQGGDWNTFIIMVKCTTDGEGGFAYASVVDNATNDASFVRGVERMTPGEQTTKPASMQVHPHRFDGRQPSEGWCLSYRFFCGAFSSTYRREPIRQGPRDHLMTSVPANRPRGETECVATNRGSSAASTPAGSSR